MQNRDIYIDTARGLCVLSVIFIHTVFWSGQAYVPDWVGNFALLPDVPLFFFLSGCTISIHPKLNPLKQILKLGLLFFLAVLVCQIIFLDFNLSYLFGPLMFDSATVPQLEVIQGSYWFIPVYGASILWGKILIDYIKNSIVNVFLFFVPVFYCYTYFTDNVYTGCGVFGGVVKVQMLLFYVWLILLGFKTYKLNLKPVWFGVSFVAAVITGIFMLIMPDFSLQEFKFPVNLPYVVASMISIGIIMGCKREIKHNFLADIGQKALYFYLAQGISSSFLFSIARLIHTSWVPKLIICFLLNALITIVIGYLIYAVEPRIYSWATKGKKN